MTSFWPLRLSQPSVTLLSQNELPTVYTSAMYLSTTDGVFTVHTSATYLSTTDGQRFKLLLYKNTNVYTVV